ncbi:hypothetical protein XELAEV_18002533mg [Xenopus laevis]|nr:hypothetical protein XELAEV_18002533mg [Xenopus laevis]
MACMWIREEVAGMDGLYGVLKPKDCFVGQQVTKPLQEVGLSGGHAMDGNITSGEGHATMPVEVECCP